MKRQACFVAMVVVAGCRAPELVGIAAPPTDPMDAEIDAPIDSGIDAAPPPAPDLVELCGAEPVTFDDWERCYKKRWCEWQVGCISLNTYRDVNECLEKSDTVEDGRLAAELRERKRAVDQGRASIDVAAFAQCLVETSGTRCNTVRASVACATRFTGTVDDGAACYTDVECSSPGAVCASSCTDSCCLGTCQPKFKLGQVCNTIDSCEPGLRCHGTCRSGDIGASCTDDRDCDPNAWCNAGVCAADHTPGSVCTNPLQCSGVTSCIGLSVDGSSSGQCLSISRPGDPCDYFCYGNLYCGNQGTCRELPELGQACSGLTPCRGVDAVCSNGQCALRGAAGAPCTASRFCGPELFCTSELGDPTPTCAARRAEGQPCADPGHCESYLCSGTTGQPGVCLAFSDTCPASGSMP